MEIKNLTTNQLNQNKYNRNSLTSEHIGSLVTYPVNHTPENCLPCNGYKLKILDYVLLHSVIGKTFNDGTEESDEFRIPAYNISGRFLQPSSKPSQKLEAGLPNITGLVGAIGLPVKVSGAFYNAGKGAALSNSGEADYNAGFEASRSNAIYGNSKTVQPPSQGVHICIRYK